MLPLQYLDIHTHNRATSEEIESVHCLSLKELRESLRPGKFNTGGIHPWWIEDLSREEIEALKVKVAVDAAHFWGIGETGIDRTYPEFFEQQLELFRWHVNLAHEKNLPLIIHNVRSGSDFLGLIKELQPKTPWIFHDFRGNEQLIKDLLRLHPDCYFSVGISLDNSPQVREMVQFIPLERLFLETDSQKHLDIHDIYLRASDQLKIDLDFLKSQTWMNFKRINSRHS